MSEFFLRWFMTKGGLGTPQTLSEKVRCRTAMVCFLVSGAGSVLTWGDMDSVSGVAQVCTLFMSMTYTVWSLRKGTIDHRMVASFSAMAVALIAAHDVYNASAMKTRPWPLFVVVIDLLTVCEVDATFRKCVMCAMALWMTVACAEGITRFGLYDAYGTPTQETRLDTLSCDDLPCKDTNSSLLTFVVGIVFIGLDCYITTTCIKALRNENSMLRLQVLGTESVIYELSNLNIEQADTQLAKLRMPMPTLGSLIDTLRGLLSYVPHLDANSSTHSPNSRSSVLSFLRSESAYSPRSSASRRTEVGRSAPQNSTVVIVFTDIQQSTFLWEYSPQGMKAALKVHNKVMRLCICAYNGYEVKTIGDAFMIAFDTAREAVRCGLRAQLDLLGSTWPEQILAVSQYEPKDGWCGLRVRMGMHCGPVDVEENPVTGRFDYLGPTVNKAARIESISVGGAIAATEEVIILLRNEGELFEDFITMPVEAVTLKGVHGKHSCCFLLPPELDKRREEILATFSETMRKTNKANSQDDSDETKRRTENLLSMRKAVPEFLKFRLHRAANITCGHVTLDYSALETAIDPLINVSKICNCLIGVLERTEGTVVSVCSTNVVVAWNTVRKCGRHLAFAVRFVGLLHNAVEVSNWGYKPSVGIASGGALFGNVGNDLHKFMMVIGSCVEMAGSLSESSKELGVYCLTCSLPGHASAAIDPSLRGLIRPIDTWVLQGNDASFTVYQLRADVMASETVQLMGYYDGSDDDWGWSDKYIEAFESGSPAMMRAATADSVVLRVANLLSTRKHLRKSLPKGYDSYGSRDRRTSEKQAQARQFAAL